MTRPAPGRFGRLERDLHGWLGEKALEEGLITAAQLDECLRECPDATSPGRLGAILVRKGYLQAHQLAGLLTAGKVVDLQHQSTTIVPPDVEGRRSDRERAFGKFILVDRLGAGGSGEVWKAWEEGLNRWVALKLLRPDLPQTQERFVREARMGARRSHRHIAAVYEAGDHEGRNYIAFQYEEPPSNASRMEPHEVARVA